MNKVKRIIAKVKEWIATCLKKCSLTAIKEYIQELIREPKKLAYKLVTLVLILVILGSGGYFIYNMYADHRSKKQFQEIQDMVNNIPENDSTSNDGSNGDSEGDKGEDGGSVEASRYQIMNINGKNVHVPIKNLDWDTMREINRHIYAWIYIPGTIIDYPVLQHPTENDYYLHKTLDHKYSLDGNIYTQVEYNSKDFTDYNTVMYGHNRRSTGQMFRTLHNFENENFFKSHQYLFIYTEKGVYIYKVFAAYVTNNAHQLANYPTNTYQEMMDYVNRAMNKAAQTGFYREILEEEHYGRILTLSTCVSDDANARYLVQGLLIYDPTQE